MDGCKDCKAVDPDQSCDDCEFKPPEVHPLAELAFHIFYNVRGCRNGEFLDFGAVFRFMELHELSPQSQLEIFEMIRAVESDWHNREMERIKKESEEHGKNAPVHRRE